MKHSGAEDWQNAGFGLYFHWPFCQSKCPYCDFNSHVSAQIEQDSWCDAYLTEIRRLGDLVPDRILQTVYFGGGTPSLMPPKTVERILDAVQSTWRIANDIEITLEANPTSVEIDKLTGFRSAGVNRLSLGLQALRDEDLRRLGRMHSAAEGLRALEVAGSVFARHSFDLIYARQHQSLVDWEQELREGLSFGADHMSLYQLTVEDGTVFGQRHARGMLHGLPTEDLGADFFDLTQQICEDAGLPAYEVSNHARPGMESRHNQIYWNSGDFGGIGPGAHGRLTIGGKRIATAAERSPAVWLAQANSGTVQDIDHSLGSEEIAVEFLLMGLRLRQGISMRRFTESSGMSLPETAIIELEELGMVERVDDMLRATAAGRPLLNAILRKLTEAL
ncbi:radical SAM family heme chaperone HemW [Gemmobacter serpentinus]|uniref:radical SAM family heme chaperone HemW n=1 Tax=Gemmobacter serpentinus TaxID=2652247 RepID=UPI001CF70298|nr:radical SAM family heme chaperone HemW [Gemmobacter serpentinus]